MNVDERACVDGLNDALARSGLSQRAFAIALGTSGSRVSTYRAGKVAPSAPLYLRALRISRSLEGARQSGWMTAPLAAAAIADALAERDEVWAFKLALQARDHLRELLSADVGLAGAWEAIPESTGSDEWDLFLAALVDHEFEYAGLPAPAWTDQPPLAAPWTLDSPRMSAEQIRDRTPEWLAKRRIFVNPHDLKTA